jgi:hypothetical protein
MNTKEFKCVDLLKDMIENDGLIGIKTSFEDEGASFDETIRLKEICNQAGTKLTLKIGGPEAIRDMKDALIIGVKGMISPMIESPFGLKKFIEATKKHIPEDSLNTIQIGINIETITAIHAISSILSIPESNNLYSVTVGRVDLVSSMEKNRDYVNNLEIYNMVKTVFSEAKNKNLKLCLGGAISIESLEFLRKLHTEGFLDKFETRYAIYDPSITLKNLPKGLSKGQMFEYEWLKCKYEYYTRLANQDTTRIQMIQDRINQSILQ